VERLSELLDVEIEPDCEELDVEIDSEELEMDSAVNSCRSSFFP